MRSRSGIGFGIAGLAVIGACTFPDVEVEQGSTRSTSTSTSSSTSGTSGGGGSAGASGTGGSAGASTTSSGMGCPADAGAMNCDVDNDGHLAIEAPCCGTDCADMDDRAHLGVTAFYSTPVLGVGGFDFNCDGFITENSDQLYTGACNLIVGGCMAKGYSADGECGSDINYLECTQVGTECVVGPATTPFPLECH